jgi:hypothetical protein
MKKLEKAVEDDKPVRLSIMDYRTDEQIVEQTNNLAGEFASVMGWAYPADTKFYCSLNTRAAGFWEMARIAQQVLTLTDADDALSNCEFDDEPKPDYAGQGI